MATLVQIEARSRRWTPHAIMAGFIATIAMGIVLIVGFVVASNAGARDGGTFTQWLYYLAHNRITTSTQNYLFVGVALYLTFGLVWAIVYAYVFEPLLQGAGWQEGLAFSMLPFLLSIIVFLPSLGGGFLGGTLNAGPLPVIGNFMLHAVYGLVLGSFYNQSISQGLDEDGSMDADGNAGQRAAMRGAERNGAVGILIGIAAGAILGTILGQTVYGSSSMATTDNLITGVGELSLAGAVLGASLGALVGSVFGLSSNTAGDREP